MWKHKKVVIKGDAMRSNIWGKKIKVNGSSNPSQGRPTFSKILCSLKTITSDF